MPRKPLVDKKLDICMSTCPDNPLDMLIWFRENAAEQGWTIQEIRAVANEAGKYPNNPDYMRDVFAQYCIGDEERFEDDARAGDDRGEQDDVRDGETDDDSSGDDWDEPSTDA